MRTKHQHMAHSLNLCADFCHCVICKRDVVNYLLKDSDCLLNFHYTFYLYSDLFLMLLCIKMCGLMFL